MISTATGLSQTGLGSISEWVGQWWLLHVKPNRDRRVAKDLALQGVKCFVPTESFMRIETRGNRIHRHREERLLFGGYVFACAADDDDEYAAKHVQNKIKTIPIIDQAKTVFELTQFQSALSRGAFGVVTNYREGEKVRIVDGPLRGLWGKFRRDRKGVIFLGMTAMGADLEVECRAEWVEAAGELD